jgi:DNA ligase 1
MLDADSPFDLIEDLPTLYARGARGEVRVWRMQEGRDRDGERGGHRVISGIKDGALTASGWTTTAPKNVGRKNATTAAEQARAEVNALYDIRLSGKYFATEDEIDNVVFTKPMLAQDYDKRIGKFSVEDGVMAQPKLDGIRCIARADGLWTRTGKPITSVPHIHEALMPFFDADPEMVFDGELYTHALADKFDKLVSIVRKAKPSAAQIEEARVMEYHVYDMPSATGDFELRHLMLTHHMRKIGQPDCVKLVETVWVATQETLDALNARWLKEGFEGQMVRLYGVPYENKRSNSLLKRKAWITDEFEVLGMLEGNGNWAGAAKTAVIRLPNGTEGEATFTGEREGLTALLASGNTPDWATVKYFGFTKDGKLRFPTVSDWGYGQRED